MEYEHERRLVIAIEEIKDSLKQINGSIKEINKKLGIEGRYVKENYPVYEDFVAN